MTLKVRPPVAACTLVVAVFVCNAPPARAQTSTPPSEQTVPGQGSPEPTSSPPEDGQARHDRAERENADRYYPEAAQRAGLSGRAVLDCEVDTKGWLWDCKIVREEPQGVGFGPAALRLVPLLRLTNAAGGKRTEVPITFKLPQEKPPPLTTP